MSRVLTHSALVLSALVLVFTVHTVSALAAFTATEPPDITFSATPTQLTAGQSTTLNWSSVGALTCVAGGGWSGSKSRYGQKTVTPLTTTTYTLTCAGRGGSALVSVTVTIEAEKISTLIGHWKFDGNTNDSSGQSQTGSAVGGPLFASSSIGQALTFDGVDDRVDIAASNDATSPLRYLLRGATSTRSFTITTWIKPTTCTRGFVVARSGFVNGISADCTNASFSLYTPSNTLVSLSDTIKKNEWNFVVAAYDQPTGTMWLSVNNRPFQEKKVGQALRDNTEPIQIGGRQGLNWYFGGGVDDVRMYATVIPRSDVSALYFATMPQPTVPTKTVPLTNAVKKSYSWDPTITKHCYSTYKSGAVGPDCGTGKNRWFIGTTNENSDHGGGTTNDFQLGDPIWTFAFHDKDTRGRYEVRNIIDKVTTNKFRDKYSFVGFSDSWDANAIPYPTLDQDIHVGFSLKVPEVQLLDDAIHGQAKARIMIGALGNWNGRSHFVEIDLWRSNDFDICTGLCDPSDTLDQMYRFSGGEGFFYTGSSTRSLLGANYSISAVGGAYQTFDVPLTKLFQGTDWTDQPASWNGIKLNGVYIGTEVWGKGKVWTELKDLETYANIAATTTPPVAPTPTPDPVLPTKPVPRATPTPTATPTVATSTSPAKIVETSTVPDTGTSESGTRGQVQGVTYPDIEKAKSGWEKATNAFNVTFVLLRTWGEEMLAVLRDRYLILSGN
jgi:hypothetical protein